MGHADTVIGDLATELMHLETATDRFAMIMALTVQTTEDDAINASNFTRFYLTPSQELVSAVALSGIEWDSPLLSDIVEMEQDQGWAPLRAAESVVKGTVRNTFMAMDSLIDQTWSRPFRIAEQMAQGDGDVGFWEAYDRSGQPELSQAIRGVATGRAGDLHTGAGWTPQRHDPREDPAIVDEFMGRYQRVIAGAQGLGGMEQIWDQTLNDMAEEMPYDVVARARDTAEATRYTVQMPDGTTEETGVSAGRFAANRLANIGGMTLIRPNTVPFTLFSGTIDGALRVGTDPLNVPADALTDFMRFGKLVVPDNAKGLGTNADAKKALEMANDWRYWVSPRTVDKWAETRTGRHTLDVLAKSGSESEIMDILGQMPTHVQRSIRKIKTPKGVLKAIRPHLGVVDPLAPTVPWRMNMVGSRVLGARGYINPRKGAAGGYTIYDQETKMGRFFRREMAEQTGGGVVLDPADPIETIHGVRQLMDTIGASVEEKDEVIRILLGEGHRHRGVVKAATKINTSTKKRLVEMGMDEVDVDEIMKPFANLQANLHAYNTDMLGNPMARMDEGFYQIPDGKGGTTNVFKPHAAHEAQFSHRTVVLPSIREYRQVTSKIRVGLEKMRKGRHPDYVPLGFNVVEWNTNMATWVRYKLDQGMSLWRNMALLRVGWPLRVLPDEAMRILASGYGNMFTDASHYMAAVMRGDMVGATGDSLDDWVKLHGGYGTGGFSRGPAMSVTGESIPNMPRDIEPAVQLSNRDWVIEQMAQGDGTINPLALEGLTDNLITLNAAGSTTLIIDHGVTKSIDILWPVGKKPSTMLTDIVKEAATDSLWGNADKSRQALRSVLENLESQIARFSGGDFYYRQVTGPGEVTGQWLNKRGAAVEFYLEDAATGNRLTHAQLNAIAEVRNGGKGIPGWTQRLRIDQKRQLLMEHDGHPWQLTEMSEQAANLTTDLGSARVHEFIARGQDPGDIMPPVPIVDDKASGFVFHGSLIQDTDGNIVSGGLTHDLQAAIRSSSDWDDGTTGAVLIYKIDDLPNELRQAAKQGDVSQYYGPGHDWVDISELGDEANELLGRGVRGYLDGEEYVHRTAPVFSNETPRAYVSITTEEAQEALQRGTLFQVDEAAGGSPRALIETSMDQRKLIELRERIPAMYDDAHPLPDTAPRAIKGHDPTPWGRNLVDQGFWWLGGLPTQRLLRHPFFQTKWSDEMARLYLWVDEPSRKAIRGLVAENHLGRKFDVFVARQLRNRGLKEVPATRINLGIEEIDEIARFNSLDHVKELLYDLTRSNNFWDSMRLITPFGEAWWEVISRWANLFNPGGEIGGVIQGGQAVRNIRRPWQVANQATKEGWFDEDEFGNEVWNVPMPFGGFQRGGARIAAQLNPSSLAFVDPSNPQSSFLPSVGPIGQTLGAFIDPILPEPFRSATRTVLYGEFQPADVSTAGKLVSSLVPTSYRRFIEAVSSGEFRNELASGTHQTFNALCGSGDPLYNCNTPRGQERAEEEARKIGGKIQILRILNAVVSPGQPQYRGQINLIHDEAQADLFTESLQSNDPAFWTNVGILREEYRVARDLFGNDNDAWNYLYNRFGVDALDFTPSTRTIKPTPITEQSYNYIREHPVLARHADLTMWAFTPGTIDDDFYYTAYKAALDAGRIQRLTVGQMASMQSVAKGAMAVERLTVVYDAAKEAIEADNTLLAYPLTRTRQLTELENWAEQERNTISNQFLTWGSDANPVGVAQRPTFEQFIVELQNFGDPTRPNYDPEAAAALRDLNPELVGFVEEVLLFWNRAELLSQNRGNQVDWWRDTKLTRDLDPILEANPAENTRAWFLNGVNQAANQLTDETARQGAVWMAERIFTPLLEGYTFEDPIVLDIMPPPIVTPTGPEEDDKSDNLRPRLAPELEPVS